MVQLLLSFSEKPASLYAKLAVNDIPDFITAMQACDVY